MLAPVSPRHASPFPRVDAIQHNLLGMAAVAQLKNDPKYAGVHQLLHIFSVEKLGEYMAFYEVHQNRALSPDPTWYLMLFFHHMRLLYRSTILDRGICMIPLNGLMETAHPTETMDPYFSEAVHERDDLESERLLHASNKTALHVGSL